MSKMIDRFTVVDDDGNEYELLVYQEMIPPHDQTGMSWLPGMKRIVTSTNMSVNFIDANTFQIVQTGQIVRKR